MLWFNCPICNKQLKAPKETAGRAGRCPCGAVFAIPGPLEEPSLPRPQRKQKRRIGTLVVASVAIIATLVFWGLGIETLLTAIDLRIREEKQPGFFFPYDIQHEIARNRNAGVVCLVLAHCSWAIAMLAVARAARWSSLAVGVAIGSLIGGLLTIPVSQYSPLPINWVVSLAEPWSRVRTGSIGTHFFILSILGALFGGGLVYLSRQTRSA